MTDFVYYCSKGPFINYVNKWFVRLAALLGLVEEKTNFSIKSTHESVDFSGRTS